MGETKVRGPINAPEAGAMPRAKVHALVPDKAHNDVAGRLKHAGTPKHFGSGRIAITTKSWPNLKIFGGNGLLVARYDRVYCDLLPMD